MTDLEKIKESLEVLKYENFEQYLFDILTAFKITNNTIQRLLIDGKKSDYKLIKIFKRASVIFNPEINDKEKFLANTSILQQDTRLIISINPYLIVCKDNASGELIEFAPNKISDNIHFFFPLIYGSGDKKRDIYATLDFAELTSKLHNELCLDSKNDYLNKSDIINDFFIQLLYISFSKSLMLNTEIEKIFNVVKLSGKSEYTLIITNIFNAILFEKKDTFIYKKLPKWNFAVEDGLEIPNINENSFILISKILGFNLLDIDTEIFGSLIYKFAKNEQTTNIYGNFTSLENVSKILNPLFVNKYENLIESNKFNKTKLNDIRFEILSLKFFDPTNGPGCFLTSAFNNISNLINTIDNLLGYKANQNIDIANFSGIVNSKLAFDLSKLTLWVTYIQYLNNNSTSFKDEDLNLIFKDINIHFGDALDISWEKICSNNDRVYIIGSPTFKGSKKLSSQEKTQVKKIFGENGTGTIDFSCCYLYLSAKYIHNSNSQCALVVTNSVCQGAQVSFIWDKIYSAGCDISFAHRSFKWKNSSELSSGVTVIIIGLCSTTHDVQPKYLYSNKVTIKTDCIGPYLINSTKTIIKKSTFPISKILPKMPKGNMPYDNQHLLLSKDEKKHILKEFPQSQKFLKKIVGSDEFINSLERWCLWIPNESLTEALEIPEISKRIELVRKFRMSKKDANTNKLALKSHQFREFRFTTTQTLVIPSVSSENRLYIPIGFVGKDTIVSNLAFSIYDCEPWVFGLISSKMHMVWIRTVCGSLETRIRYSSTLGYNTFPFPEITNDKKNKINDLVYSILNEREKHSEFSLGKLYSNMPETLIILHKHLDILIDSCYQDYPFTSDMDRLKTLFYLYDNKN